MSRAFSTGSTVTVKPDPNAAIKLFSFETGTEGWGPENGLPATGTRRAELRLLE